MSLPRLRIRPLVAVLATSLAFAATAAAAADIEVSAEQAKSLQIGTTPVAAAGILSLARLPAEVVVPLESSRTVSIPFAGVVAGLSVDEGARVAAGAPLARVQSRDFLAARADLARSGSEAVLARNQAKRDAALLAEGIIARSRADETSARAADVQARLAQARGALAGVGIPAGAAAGEYELRAPVAGRVLRRAIAPGQAVGAFEPAFVIAAGDGADVLLQAPIAWSMVYAPGLAIVMDDGARGEVVAVAAATEGDSQSVRLRARLSSSKRWLVGQRTSVRLELPAPDDSVRVPETALVSDGTETFVYVADGTRYRTVAVERLGGDGDGAIVRGPLKPGDAVVVAGASTLKSM